MRDSLETTNSIIVHQAYFGETDKSHGCLTMTLPDGDLKSFLTAFTDRPSSLPAGINLEPYFSGIVHGKYYVYSATFPDANASRGGMVFTHALIIGLDELINLHDLTPLFSSFVTTIPTDRTHLNPLILDKSILDKRNNSDYFPKYVQQTVASLISSSHPVIYCGSLETFSTTITTIWAGLPVGFRKSFSFTAGFSLNNIDQSKTILHFQKSLQPTLNNQNVISDEEIQEVAITSQTEEYLLRHRTNNAFEAFLAELNVKLNDWTVLSPCVKAFDLYSRINGNLTPDELRLLIRYIAKISLFPNDGKKIKNEVINKLEEYISLGKDDNIKALKNLPISPFYDAVNSIALAVEKFFTNAFTNQLPFNANEIGNLCVLADQSGNTTWWHTTITTSMQRIVGRKSDPVFNNIWKLLIYNENYVDSVIKLIPQHAEYERLLIDCQPASIEKKTAESLSKKMQKRKWFLLHAHLLLKYLLPREAIVKQIELEENQHPESFAGTTFLASKVSDSELKAVVLSEENDVLITELAKRTVSNPSLLASCDVGKPVWLKIWSASLLQTKNLQHGIKNLLKILQEIFDQIINQQTPPEVILDLISNSEYADISNYPKRKEFWSRVPAKYKTKFLVATTNGYVDNLVKGTLITPDLEPELHAAVTDDRFIGSFLNQRRNDINAVLTIYENVQGLKDKSLSDYIHYYTGNLSEMQSHGLGVLIQKNGFKLSAKGVFEKAKRNGSFKIALNLCKSLLNLTFWDLWAYGGLLGETVSKDAIYTALLETSVETYTLGPEDRDIWKRAGGDISKLSNFKSREENWRHAIELLRYGGGGKNITTKSLVKEMLEDYPNNDQLKVLVKCL